MHAAVALLLAGMAACSASPQPRVPHGVASAPVLASATDTDHASANASANANPDAAPLVAPAAAPEAANLPAGAMPAGDSLLLLSLDGFRADYLQLGITPNLAALAARGVRARWMTPSYPVLTFPNHYTLVTGLLPDHHGIVHNTMLDADLGGFKVSDARAVGEARWWGGEPIWVGAAKADMPSAALFWPGSEAAIGGHRPTRWLPFDSTMPLEARIDTMAGWLAEARDTRPRVAVMYLETVDEAAHAWGPHSPQALDAVRAVDAAIGRLLGHLQATGRLSHTNLLVVSDHGMATVAPGQVLAVEDMVTLEEAAVVSVGQVVGIAPRKGHEAAVAGRLLGAHPQYACWRKAELPARWRYGTHPRIPPIVCQMREGWDALARTVAAERPGHARGSHGYDPDAPALRALFVAGGPAFRSGVTLAPFANVDVYPLLARLVGITPAANDGDAGTLSPALRATCADLPQGTERRLQPCPKTASPAPAAVLR